MKHLIFCFGLAFFLFSCKDNETKTKGMATTTTDSTVTQPAADLPFKASYSSQWNNDVSDADLRMVLTTYRDWENNNMSGLLKSMGDSVELDMSSGEHSKKTNAELMKMWSVYRDSLSSVKINMEAWNKMHSVDKKDNYIVTWYEETDTYKNGKVDSASYHDINQVKDGKIIWYSQFKRIKK
jgi:ketosteroid isomerase-like protein